MAAYLRPLVSGRLITTIISQRKKNIREIEKSKNPIKSMLALRPKLVLLLTDVLQSYLSASLSASASVSRAWETKRLLYFRDTGSHVVLATIQQFAY